jgi:hypothetical protein
MQQTICRLIFKNLFFIHRKDPVLKDPVLNDLDLPKKEYYTTKDACKVLNIKPDTLKLL